MNKNQVRSIVFLIGAYVMAQLIADIGATKFIEISGIVMPAGTFVFALTFTLRDMIHKRLGKEWAKAAIFTAAIANIFLSFYLWAMSFIKSPVWFNLGESWNSIFAIVPAITLGSIVAEMVSELIDTEIYHNLTNSPQWQRVLISNLVSIPIDSLVFSVLAFSLFPLLFGGEAMSLLSAITNVTIGQIIYKAIVAVVSIPGIYLVKSEKIFQ